MKTECLIEVVNTLVGPSIGIGESNVDVRRLENVQRLAELTETLVDELVTAAEDHNSHMHSVKRIGETAQEALLRIAESLECATSAGSD